MAHEAKETTEQVNLALSTYAERSLMATPPAGEDEDGDAREEDEGKEPHTHTSMNNHPICSPAHIMYNQNELPPEFE